METKLKNTILKHQHFNNKVTQLKNGGLSFEMRIDAGIRENCLKDLDGKYLPTGEYIDRFSNMRGSSFVKINPQQTSSRTLLAIINKTQKANGEFWHSPIPKYGYNLKWTRTYCNDKQNSTLKLYSEGQSFIAVVYDGRNPVGYSSFAIEVMNERGSRDYQFKVNVGMVYVLPNFRGKGYGIDLSVACSTLCGEVYEGIHGALPSRSSLKAEIEAEIHTEGGSAFVDSLAGELIFITDIMSEHSKRKSIKIDKFEYHNTY